MIPRIPNPIHRIPTLIPRIPTLIFHILRITRIPALIPCIPSLIPRVVTLIPRIFTLISHIASIPHIPTLTPRIPSLIPRVLPLSNTCNNIEENVVTFDVNEIINKMSYTLDHFRTRLFWKRVYRELITKIEEDLPRILKIVKVNHYYTIRTTTLSTITN